MITIIAEKPSVAREIAAIVGAKNRQEDYLEGNNYCVTWAIGHLIQLAMPEQYGVQCFIRESLPIIPNAFQLIPRQTKVGKEYKADAGVVKQLKVIQSLFESSERIIVATDAGREGELIFRYIYSYLKCKKPFDRLWISSLTEKAITEGLQNLKNGADYDKLYFAAQAGSEADWLVGINASQALSINAKQGVFSLGRVQTPTLAMVCSRYLENKEFKPTSYWELFLDLGCDGVQFSTTIKERILTHSEAKFLFEKQKQERLIRVENVLRKGINELAPLLYDLTSLQKDANAKHGLSASKTLSIAQNLYESKYITYPRTGSRYISEDVFAEIPMLIQKLSDYERFSNYAQKMIEANLNTHAVNDKKVTDHHALLITGHLPKDLGLDERKIYDLIAGRMLESFTTKCVKDQTIITLVSADLLYETKGTAIKELGWREVFKEVDSQNENEKLLPPLEVGQELSIDRVQLLEKQTKAKPLHTESSLLATMESAGKDLENEEQREALKTCGIGTPATRASIIETLFSRAYMIRDKKSLVPTEKGLAVYHAVKNKRIADIEMTGMWEDALSKIESGTMNADDFTKGIEIYTGQITYELLNAELNLVAAKVVECPKCKQNINFYPKVTKCSDEHCDFIIFNSLAGQVLSNDIICTLISGKQTAIVRGFKSKADNRFDAALILDENFKIKFIFPEKKRKKKS